MNPRKVICAVVFIFATMSTGTLQRAAPRLAQEAAEESVPAFHAQPPHGPLPATLSPQLFPNAVLQNAYGFAARVKKLLYQQPCYCRCDRSQGHSSLLDCFAGRHAAECEVCIREGLFVYEQSRNGKSAAQIRAGIEKGEWRSMDLSKYQKPPAASQAN
jgi:Protein of unknown function with PCYCGC motif